MKATAQARRSSAKPGFIRAGAPRVQAKARPGGAANHRRQGRDSFERQAEEIASRIMRGEKNLARRITPTGASGFRPTGSNGMPLPRAVRQEMESSFGADFRAVRIHAGAAADSAAHDYEANAFASGRDIYFRAGQYAPHTTAGKELLAHELTHVLQQTGRPGSAGTLTATARTGTAEPQCDDEDTGPYRDALVPFLAADQDSVTPLIDHHQTAAPTDESLKKFAEVLRSLVPDGKIPRKTTSTVGWWLQATAQDLKFKDNQDVTQTLSVAAKGLLVDCLKVCDTEAHHAAAATLIDADTNFELKTAFAARTEFNAYLWNRFGQQWLSEAFKQPLLKQLWSHDFLHAYTEFFLSPNRVIQGLIGLETLQKGPFANLHGVDKALLPGDRNVLALDLILENHKNVLLLLETLQKQVDKDHPDASATSKRYHLALSVRDQLAKMAADETVPYWKAMLTDMHRVTDDAGKLWGAVVDVDATLQNEFDGRFLYGELLTFERPISGDFKVLEPLRAIFLALTKPAVTDAAGKQVSGPGLLHLEIKDKQPVVPTPTEYAARIAKLDQALGLKSNLPGNVLLTLQLHLTKLAMGKKVVTPEGTAVGWTFYVLKTFTDRLHNYDAAADSAQYPDKRLAHRMDVADFVVRVSQALGWADVLAPVASVGLGEDFPNSYLIVPGKWVRIDEAPIEQMATDLNADHPFESLPLTARELVYFFQGTFLHQLQKLVQDEVDRVNADPSLKLSAEGINAAILNIGRPWRVDPPLEIQSVVRPVDHATTDAFTLIRNNAWSMAELARIGKESGLSSGMKWLARSRGEGSGPNALEIFAWIIPDIKPLIWVLQNAEPFKTRMADFKAADEIAWLRELLVRNGAPGQTPRAEIDTTLEQYAKDAQGAANASLRQFTTINRRQAADVLRKEIQQYADDPTVTNFGIPYKFADAVIELAVKIAPSIDEKPQLSLFLLDLAPDLEKAFGDMHHAARLQPYLLSFFTDAISFALEAEAGSHPNSSPEVRDFYNQFVYHNPNDSSKDESLATLVANAPKLQTVVTSMEKAAKELQLMLGFLSRDGVNLHSVLMGPAVNLTPMHLLNPFRETPLVNNPRIEPGERYAMEIDGDDWELVEVHRKFFYHPALENMAADSQAAKAELLDEEGNPLPDGTPLMTFLVNGEERVLKGGDNDALKKLSDAIFTATLVQKLDQMGQEIEEDMTFMMDLIELHPAMWKFAAIRATAMTAGAVKSGEYDDILKMIKEDPVSFITDIAGDLMEKYLTLEGVLKFVVLQKGGFDMAQWHKPSAAKRTSRTLPRGKVARLIAILRRLGGRIATSLAWVRLRTAPRLRAVQSTVATRPRVGWLLRRSLETAAFVSNLIPADAGAGSAVSAEDRKLAVLRDLSSADPQLAPPGTPPATQTPDEKAKETSQLQSMLGPIGEGMQAAAADFRTQLVELLDTLSEMELPDKIVPDGLVLTIVTDLVMLRLGAKVKFAYKALKAAGVVQAVNDAIGARLATISANPNSIWESHIIDKIEKEFLETRNGTIESIYGITNTLAAETGLDFFGLGEPPLKSAGDFKIQRSELTESELSRKPGRRVRPAGGATELPAGSGQPLPPAVQRNAEEHFGHNFNHVRVHADAKVTDLLANFGAEGLTTGSHVYLPNAEPIDDTRLLRHELTHVLQQAGSRPLGRDYSPQPVPGRPGLGVRFYPERESEAEQHARRQTPASAPVPVHGAGGVQPSGIDPALLATVVETFTEIESAKDFEAPAGSENTPGAKTANLVWRGILSRLDKKNFKSEDCFEPALDLIVAYLKHSGFDNDIVRIAALAQQPDASQKQKKRPQTEFDFSRFITLLEGALYGKTGLVFQFTAKEKPAVEITGMKLTYLHFGAVSPGTNEGRKLWEAVLKNTPTIKVGPSPMKTYQEVHEWLRALGPQPFAWTVSAKKFGFSGDFAETFNKTRNVQVAKTPKREDYLAPTPQTGIGLRIGAHHGQSGTQRESHHTTQYLLIQYFRNHNTVKAWQAGRKYPGINPASGNDAVSFDGPQPIQLSSLDSMSSVRGAEMPAILIAADTHRRGQVHVEKESFWSGPAVDPDSDAGQGRATQGFAIKSQFQRRLLATFKTTDEDKTVWNAKMNEVGDSKAKTGIQEAMLGTYQWMYGIMKPSLERALCTRELAYYRAMAARDGHLQPSGELHDDYKITSGDMKAVAEAAVTNNTTVMGGKGWTL